MKINVDFSDNFEVQKGKITKHKSTFCFLSLCRLLALICTLFVILSILLLCKVYINTILIWLEKQDTSIVITVIFCLFFLVSLPISIGYIVLVVASGYLFSLVKGIIIVIFGANFGIFLAHNVLKIVGHNKNIYKLTQNEMALAIMRVISGPLCFKIVFCARLTPIPFGLQNAIFALSNVNSKIYHIASLFGLFPAQLVGVYVGSTLRCMQDVLEDKRISSSTYFFVTLQLLFGASLMVWIGTKARKELIKAIAEADSTNGTTKVNEYSYV